MVLESHMRNTVFPMPYAGNIIVILYLYMYNTNELKGPWGPQNWGPWSLKFDIKLKLKEYK